MSVATGPIQAAFCETFVDELVRAGVTDAVVSPGSRSTPLALAIAASPLRRHIRLDERSACFVALGLARSTGRAVLVLVTSGTAAAELHAGVVEAHLDRVPLIVATADRPPELHGVGAPQTIDQHGIFGAHVLSAIDPGPVHALPLSAWRPLVSRLVLDATAGVHPGPVVINLPFVEPLVAEPGAQPSGRSGGRPWFSIAGQPSSSTERMTLPSGRGLIVVGADAGPAEDVLAAGHRLGWPVIADPRSGCRSEDPVVITVADTILRDEHLAASLRPDVIVLAGAPGASKVVAEWIDEAARGGASLVLVGDGAVHRHPAQLAADLVMGRPDEVWPILWNQGPIDEGWLETWASLQRTIDGSFSEQLGESAWSEPAVLRSIAQLDEPVTVVVSSSMPVRDLEWFGGRTARPSVVHANRGANGIDGVVSTAIGVALGDELPVVAVVGDLTFLHDVSALVEGLGDGVGSLTVVVLDNAGGGIFSFLPQRSLVPESTFRELFTTPRSPRPADVARGFGLRVHEVNDQATLVSSIIDSIGRAGMTVIVCGLPDHDTNVNMHAELVSKALGAASSAGLS